MVTLFIAEDDLLLVLGLYQIQPDVMVMDAGGSRSKGASVLTRLHELLRAEDELAAHLSALADAEGALKGLSAAAREHKK